VCIVAARGTRKHPKLARAPLASVVCQARFGYVIALDTEEGQNALLARLQQRLPDYPLFRRVAQQTVLLSPQGIEPADQRVSSFEFSSDDGAWTVGVSPDSVSLQTRRYEDFRDFQIRWSAVADAIRQTLKPSLQTRFGLRYTDELTAPSGDTPARWAELLKSQFYGLGVSSRWRNRVKESFQQWVLELDDGQCTLRHGFLPTLFEGRTSFYLLDIDCFVEESQPFDVDAQTRLLDTLQ
jgi:uncharacterized protein (TIGR04255 family)